MKQGKRREKKITKMKILLIQQQHTAAHKQKSICPLIVNI